ncbi:MAG: leucine-rich repeat protein [Firmicutes bacterium]|nr:leucine-rich repeat protein [Bacillota bacterium]
MKKLVKIVFLSLLIALLALSLVACGGDGKKQPEPQKLPTPVNLKISGGVLSWDSVPNASGYSVQVDNAAAINNGGFTQYAIPPCEPGATLTLWVRAIGDGVMYLDSDFSVPITYKDDTKVESPDPVITFTVTFNANGGSAVAPITVNSGAQIAKPADPTKSGFTFSGWFTDAELTVLAAFPLTLTQNATLYAKWTQLSDPGTPGLGFRLINNGAEYEVFHGTIPSNVTQIVVPAEYEGKPVTKVANNAFMNSFSMPSLSLVSITLPKGITHIGNYAFYGRDKLRDILLPDTLTDIGNNAFYGCNSLNGVLLPDALTGIGSRAFYNCRALTEIVFPPLVTSLGDYAFYYCAALKTVKLSPALTVIGQSTFYGCTQLSEVTLPDALKTIGDTAFNDCPYLRTVDIPASVTQIGVQAFRGCNNLLVIMHSDTPAAIQDGTFGVSVGVRGILVREGAVEAYKTAWSAYEEKVAAWDFHNKWVIADNTFLHYFDDGTDFTVPSGVTAIGNLAFAGYDALISVTVPAGVKSIGNNAFNGCTSLVSVALPAGLTTISTRAFRYCEALATISLPASLTSIGANAFEGCTALKSIEMPTGLTAIGSSAFSGCVSLSGSVEIAASVTSVGSNAFLNCTALESIRMLRTTPEGMTLGSVWNGSTEVVWGYGSDE